MPESTGPGHDGRLEMRAERPSATRPVPGRPEGSGMQQARQAVLHAIQTGQLATPGGVIDTGRSVWLPVPSHGLPATTRPRLDVASTIAPSSSNAVRLQQLVAAKKTGPDG
jgi:hypothetical protein